MRGRDDELAVLQQAWEDARAGQVRYVRIAGEPGTGKTRLVQAFYELLSRDYDPPSEDHPEGYWPDLLEGTQVQDTIRPSYLDSKKPPPMPFFWWALRCNAGNEQLEESFAPYSDGVDQVFQHLTGLLQAKLRKQAWVELAVEAVEGTLGAILVLGTAVAVVSGIKDLAEFGKKMRATGRMKEQAVTELRGQKVESRKLEDMVMQYIAALNDAGDKNLPTVPVVIALDDAQWADIRTIAFTQRLLVQAAEREWKLLVISTIRSNELAIQLESIDEPAGLPRTAASLERGLVRKKGAESVVRIDIDNELDDSAAKEVLRDNLSHPTDATLDRLLERTGRQPFYLVNYAALIREREWLDLDGNLTASDDQLRSIPKEITEIIDERLEHLDSKRLQVLQWGSVQGQRFFEELIRRVAEEIGEFKASAAVRALGRLRDVHELVGNAPPPPEDISRASVLASPDSGTRAHQNAE